MQDNSRSSARPCIAVCGCVLSEGIAGNEELTEVTLGAERLLLFTLADITCKTERLHTAAYSNARACAYIKAGEAKARAKRGQIIGFAFINNSALAAASQHLMIVEKKSASGASAR